ncbi:MAG TPA: right-handed parallel beta-helix repeat-containing protein [Acidimicrobiales bacterium]|nr:right-handed parallel beta-helix repeat-containing protein [Acidimicrobiales bacterium]
MSRSFGLHGRRFGRLVAAAALVVGSGTLVALTIASPAAAASTLKVSTTGHDTGDCTETNCLTLGYALSQAHAASTILLEPGTYPSAHNPPGTSDTVVPALSGLTIASDPAASGTASNTVIDATGAANGLVINANQVTVNGLSILNADNEGICITPSTPSISGCLFTPPATPAPPVSVTGAIIENNIVNNNDACINHPTAADCPQPPNPFDDYGETIHLQSVANSTVANNVVENNVGGILLTDEVGPTDGNNLSGNTVSNNATDCGITLAGHSTNAVSTSGPTTGQPQPSQAGVYNNLVVNNTANGNGAAGLLAAAGGSGSAVYNNTFSDNTAIGNGLAGMTIHSHAPLQDINGNVVTGNNFSNDALHGGPGGGPGDVEGPPGSANLTQTAGVQVLSVFAPLTGTVIQGNIITNVFYGIWQSALASSSAISGNNISVTAGGTPVFTVPAAGAGYWMSAGDGGVFSFGGSAFYGAVPGFMGAPTVGMARTPDSGGYWQVGSNGNVLPFGDATVYGTLLGKALNAPIVGMAATQDGGGYWLVASDGGLFGFGDATFMGSMGGQHLNAPIVGIAATPSGGGYWMVASDGGIFSFGDAKFFGSMGGQRLNKPIVGIASTAGSVNPSNGSIVGDGYWLVASDGGVFNFGNAGFMGSMGGQPLNKPIVSIIPGPYALNFSNFSLQATGYWLVASDGGVFSFGKANFFGSLGSLNLVSPVNAAAST